MLLFSTVDAAFSSSGTVPTEVTPQQALKPERQTPSRTFYRPELDLLRLLAFLLVFWHHASTLQSNTAMGIAGACGSGMQLFFLLSSYLITELLLQEKEKTGRINIPSFYVRRVLRIWPLYFSFLIAAFLAAKLQNHGVFPTSALIAFVLLAGNWWVYVNGFLISVAGPLWSISVEEQFYLVWPFLFARTKVRTVCAVLPIIIAVSMAAVWYDGYRRVHHSAYWSNSFSEFQFFAAGALLAIFLHNRRVKFSSLARLGFVLIAVAAFGTAGVHYGIARTDFQPASVLLPGFLLLNVGAVSMFLAFYGIRIRAVFSPLIYLGRISYGLYVFHALTISLSTIAAKRFFPNQADLQLTIRVTAGLLLAIAAASCSYTVLEKPFLRLKQRFTFVRSRD